MRPENGIGITVIPDVKGDRSPYVNVGKIGSLFVNISHIRDRSIRYPNVRLGGPEIMSDYVGSIRRSISTDWSQLDWLGYSDKIRIETHRAEFGDRECCNIIYYILYYNIILYYIILYYISQNFKPPKPL